MRVPTDPDAGDTLQYMWDFGDGVDTGWTNNPVATHAYTAAGTYNATVYVRDSHGEEIEDTTEIDIEAKPKPKPKDDDDDEEPFSMGLFAYDILIILIIIIVIVVVLAAVMMKKKKPIRI